MLSKKELKTVEVALDRELAEVAKRPGTAEATVLNLAMVREHYFSSYIGDIAERIGSGDIEFAPSEVGPNLAAALAMVFRPSLFAASQVKGVDQDEIDVIEEALVSGADASPAALFPASFSADYDEVYTLGNLVVTLNFAAGYIRVALAPDDYLYELRDIVDSIASAADDDVDDLDPTMLAKHAAVHAKAMRLLDAIDRKGTQAELAAA